MSSKINKKELLSSKYLQDAIFDSRINDNILLMYERLYSAGVVLKCLENYEIENIDYRDQEMAKKFLNIIKENRVDKYFVYVGGMHALDKSIQIKNFKINPINIYLPQEIRDNLLVIQFNRGKKEEIRFYKKTKIINYNLVLKEVKANYVGIC